MQGKLPMNGNVDYGTVPEPAAKPTENWQQSQFTAFTPLPENEASQWRIGFPPAPEDGDGSATTIPTEMRDE